MQASARERTLSHAGSELGSVPEPATEVRRGLFALPGGTKAILAFVVSICSYTAQTELAQVVQSRLGYKKPFLSLWLGHSLFSILLPCHLLFLVKTTRYPLSHWINLITKNLDWQLSTTAAPTELYSSLPTSVPSDTYGSASTRRSGLRGLAHNSLGFDLHKLVGILFILTVGITIPSLSWYAAVPMTTMADITAIYNTFSVFALVFSVFFLGESWERRKVVSVGLATIGVIIVAYGGSSSGSERGNFTNPVLGSLLALFGALTMGAYEVVFTLIAKLPDEETQAKIYARPGSRRTRSRTISGAFVRTPALSRLSSDATIVSPSAGSNKRRDLRNLFNVDDENESGEAANRSSRNPEKTTNPASHERTALVIDDEIGSGRTSYESIGAGGSSSPSRASATLISTETETGHLPTSPSPHSPTLHGPSPLRKTFQLENTSRSELGANSEVEANESETESELQDGEEEEILAGATRMSRSRSRSKAVDVLGANGGFDDDDDANGSGPQRAGSYGPDTSGQGARVNQAGGRTFRGPTSHNSHESLGIPPPLPFGLHATIMTSGIGYVTFLVLWVGVVIGHITGLEPFEIPPNVNVVSAMFGVGLLGVVFNGCFTLLLALWGPVLASVSIIGATVLVEIADVLLGQPLKLASIAGCALIVAGFVVLVGGTEEVVEEVGPEAGAHEGVDPA
ncbi:hypothetical protein OC845_003155 [Tilletia horrida]|nr:hypothetical protein OC845_003155 [Tilletia horrida]